MVEKISIIAAAPFIKSIDENTLEAKVILPAAVKARLENPNFNVEQNSYEPARYQLHLIPTSVSSADTDATMDELVAKEFDNSKWQSKVQKAMANQGLIQTKANFVDDRQIISNYTNTRDDYFTVRIDNLPEGTGNHELTNLLLKEGCDYFVRVKVPRGDDNEFKRFGFIKFERLRHALKFMEDHNKILVNNMVLNVALAV